jgi:uncharacterized protein YbaP (TraB family)
MLNVDHRRRRTGVGLLLALVASPALCGAPPIWEIRGAANTVTLLGSIHFLRPEDPLPATVIQAYEKAEVIVMELDLDDTDPLAMQELIQKLGVDPQGRSLEILLGADEWRRAQQKARAIDLELDLVRGFEPWLAAVSVTQLRLQQLGFQSDCGVEQRILQRARGDRKEIRGLETAEEQLSLLDRLPAKAQRTFLMVTLDEAAEIGDKVDDIVRAWQTGDTKALEDEFLKGLRDQPEIYRSIVAERNRNWVKPIVALTRAREDYLVVVGTLHLVGPDSVIRLLTEAGVQPRQLGAD